MTQRASVAGSGGTGLDVASTSTEPACAALLGVVLIDEPRVGEVDDLPVYAILAAFANGPGCERDNQDETDQTRRGDDTDGQGLVLEEGLGRGISL